MLKIYTKNNFFLIFRYTKAQIIALLPVIAGKKHLEKVKSHDGV